MKSSCKVLSIAAVVLALGVGSAFANPAGKFSRADVNKDGVLSKVEACSGITPRICKHFDRIDANKDGVVTPAELKAYRNAKRAARGLPPKP